MKQYVVTLHVSENRLSALIGAVTPEATIKSILELDGEPSQMPNGITRKIVGRAARGTNTPIHETTFGKLVMAQFPNGGAIFEGSIAYPAVVKAGYKETSVSSVLSGAVRAGALERVRAGFYRLPSTKI